MILGIFGHAPEVVSLALHQAAPWVDGCFLVIRRSEFQGLTYLIIPP